MKPKTKRTTKSKPLKLLSAAAIELKTLAKQANDAHARTIQHGDDLLKAAVECGGALLESKEVCAHGDWLPWLERNCREISHDTATRYMRIAKNGVKDARSLTQAYRQTGLIVLSPVTKAPIQKQLNAPPPQDGPGATEADQYAKSIGLGPKQVSAPAQDAAPAPVTAEPKAKKGRKAEPDPEAKPVPVPEPKPKAQKPIATEDEDLFAQLAYTVRQVMVEIENLDNAPGREPGIRATLEPIAQWLRCRGEEL